MNPFKAFTDSVASQKKASPFSMSPGSSSISSLFAQPAAKTSATSTISSAFSGGTQSPSAVMPVPSPTKPAATVGPTASPKEQFISSVSAAPANPGISEAQIRSNLASYTAQNQPQNSQNAPSGSTGSTGQTGSSGGVSDPKDAFLKSYRDYLAQYSTAVQPSSAIAEAGTKLADIQSKIDERKLKGDQTYQAKLDQPGMLKAGAQSDATQFARRENADLANLAVQEGAAARTLSALTGARTADIEAAKIGAEINKPIQIGDKYYDPQTGAEVGGKDAGFTLSPGENRYDASGKLIASGGAKPMTAAQEAAQVKQQEQETQAQQQASQTLGIINDLLNTGRYKAISGGTQTGSVPFFGDRAAVNQYDQLQGLLKLGIRGLLKGQGAVSDYEGKVLGQAASSLSRLTSEDQMKQALQTVRGVIRTNNGQITSVTVTNPETGEAITDSLSGPEIYQLVSEGNTVTYN